MKQYAVKVKDHLTFLCIDDKAKVDIGEQNQYISTGVRGKKPWFKLGHSSLLLAMKFLGKGLLHQL